MYPEAIYLPMFALLTGLAMLLGQRLRGRPAGAAHIDFSGQVSSRTPNAPLSCFIVLRCDGSVATGHGAFPPAVPVDHGGWLLTVAPPLRAVATVTDPVASRPGRPGGT